MGGGVEETRSTYGTGSGHTGTPAMAKKVPAFNQKQGNRRPPAKRHAYKPGGRMRVSDQQYAEASRQDERPALHITLASQDEQVAPAALPQ